MHAGFADGDDPDDVYSGGHQPTHPSDYGSGFTGGDDDLDGSAGAGAHQSGHNAQPSFESEGGSVGASDGQDPVAFLREKRMQTRSEQEQVKHFLGRQLVTANWEHTLGSNSVDELSAIVVAALRAAQYQDTEWVPELEAMAAEGVLETFVRACVEPPQGDPQHDEPDKTLSEAFWEIFMGEAPEWYKQAVVGALVLNIVVRGTLGPDKCAWCVLLEFIGTLAMATHCCEQDPPQARLYTCALVVPQSLRVDWCVFSSTAVGGCCAVRSTAARGVHCDGGIRPGAFARVSVGDRG